MTGTERKTDSVDKEFILLCRASRSSFKNLANCMYDTVQHLTSWNEISQQTSIVQGNRANSVTKGRDTRPVIVGDNFGRQWRVVCRGPKCKNLKHTARARIESSRSFGTCQSIHGRRVECRACERSGKRSGAGPKSGGAERAWQKTIERKRGRSRSGNRAWSGLKRPLTARSNLTFHWLHNVYCPHSNVCSLQFSVFTLLFFMHCLVVTSLVAHRLLGRSRHDALLSIARSQPMKVL